MSKVDLYAGSMLKAGKFHHEAAVGPLLGVLLPYCESVALVVRPDPQGDVCKSTLRVLHHVFHQDDGPEQLDRTDSPHWGHLVKCPGVILLVELVLNNADVQESGQ